MKRTLLLTLVLLCTGLTAFAQKGFTGSITYAVSGDELGKGTNFTMHGDGVKLRLDITVPQGQFSVITQGDDSPVLTLLHQQKMAMEIDMAMAQTMMGSAGSGVPDMNGKVRKTGRTETIHGHPCDVYEVATEDGTATLYCATDMGTFSGFGLGGPTLGDLEGQNTVPLKVVVTKPDKQGSLTMEATKVSSAKPSADKFVLPSGYTLMPIGR